MSAGTTKILVVEDNLGDILLIREALAHCSAKVDVSVARDGLSALDLLGECAKNGLPGLILLDLNLPRMDGRELLRHLKNDPGLRSIPVIVFTSSNAPQDIANAYDLQANCYLVKPLDLTGFEQVIRHVNDFWLKTVHLPRQ